MAIVLLENIRSVFNVGSVFRTSDATAIEKILLVGYTACPIDRMNRENLRLHKTALGSEKTVEWEHFENSIEAIKKYSSYTPIVVEQTNKSIPYNELFVEKPIFIFGNEVDGVEEETLEYVPKHIHLPMQGDKESLNVSSCAAVVLYNFINIK